VVGNSGSGKTTVAAALATRLGLPHVELDSIFHQPGWQPLPRVEFRARIAAVADTDEWVVDGNYSAVADLLDARADTIVWIDLPRRTVMRQIIGRTVRRVSHREELWNGNRERWRNLFSRNPEASVIAWAWTRHAVYAERYGARAAAASDGGPEFVRLRSRAQVRAFLAAASQPADGGHGASGSGPTIARLADVSLPDVPPRDDRDDHDDE
jgi:adenylate kinase family enzyme